MVEPKPDVDFDILFSYGDIDDNPKEYASMLCTLFEALEEELEAVCGLEGTTKDLASSYLCSEVGAVLCMKDLFKSESNLNVSTGHNVFQEYQVMSDEDEFTFI